MRGLNGGKLHRPNPKLLARSAVEAVQVSLLSVVFRAGDKDAPVRNNGAAIARTRQGRFPADVFPRPPVERRFVFVSDTVPITASECGPVVCHCGNRHHPKDRRPGTAKPCSCGLVHHSQATLSDHVSRSESLLLENGLVAGFGSQGDQARTPPRSTNGQVQLKARIPAVGKKN